MLPGILVAWLKSNPRVLEDLEPTFRGFLTGHSQTPLAYVRWEHPDPKGRVVLSHGYGEHAERYRHTAKWLHDLGWSVSAMDHRGFGRSGGRRGDASGIRAFVEELALFLRHERHHDIERTGADPRIVEGVPVLPPPTQPQVLLGHSFGGLVAVLDAALARGYPGRPDPHQPRGRPATHEPAA